MQSNQIFKKLIIVLHVVYIYFNDSLMSTLQLSKSFLYIVGDWVI